MQIRFEENRTSEIAIRICITLGALGLVSSLVFIFLPGSLLVSLATKLALKLGDPQRIASAGFQRLQLELDYIIQKLKISLPFFPILVLIWAFLWRLVLNKSKKEVSPSLAGETYLGEYLLPIRYLLGILVISFMLRIVNFNQSLWLDECLSVIHCVGIGFLKAFTYNNHILYSWLARISILIFGNKEWALRLPSLFFGIAGIYLLTKLAGLFKDKNIVWISVALFAFSPIHIDQSSQARGYTALVFFSILSCYFLLRAIREEKKYYWRGFVAASVLGLYTHLYMWMVLASQIITVLLGVFLFKENKNNRISLIRFKTANHFFWYSTIIGMITFLLYIPPLPLWLFNILRNYPRQTFSFGFLSSLFGVLSSGEQGFNSWVMYIILYLAGIIYMWRREKVISILAAAFFVVPLALVSLFKPTFLYTRYFIFALPVYLIFIACGIYGISSWLIPKRKILIQVVFTTFLIILCLPSIYIIFTQDRQNYREAARFIEERFQKNTVLVCPGITEDAISYYLKDYLVINANTLPKVEKIIGDYNQVIFFVSFRGSIEPQLLKFIENNYKSIFFCPSRISSVSVYIKRI